MVKTSKKSTRRRGRCGKKSISIKNVHDQFSLWIRNRDGWRCQVCGVDCAENRGRLQASHFISRSVMTVTFDPDNVDAFCSSCHVRWENRKNLEYHDWKLKQLGEERFQALRKRAYQSQKIGGFTQTERREFMDKFRTTNLV